MKHFHLTSAPNTEDGFHVFDVDVKNVCRVDLTRVEYKDRRAHQYHLVIAECPYLKPLRLSRLLRANDDPVRLYKGALVKWQTMTLRVLDENMNPVQSKKISLAIRFSQKAPPTGGP
ncbi:hypothetical protein HDV00_012770 [Rhizophlyctis rosea]|nr:hypothetical protein HDV00_012770 [Rhizophlyctis rosea]